ncbi:hypothetical protein OJF2_15440 [Aquisphaera giovannonii]|uniref:EF-hand domain-containing protein n=1 Tax=Aquisphaera giovannonii TaxID=406548 RepID=A0A5B9VXN6_9BACT|nr:carboxypeptidase-like regulatory domain-containing protein [Aquisphaera giovannonii]QEH33048.1 hypothetical protein OJF2_15440 [Aquisphaera giovannonii]
MTRPSTTGRGRWRDAGAATRTRPSGPTKAGKGLLAALVSAIVLATVGFLGFLIYIFVFGPENRTSLIPFLVTSYRRDQISPVPGAAAERRAMAATGLQLRHDPLDADGDLTLENFATKLNNLRGEKPAVPIVAYVSAYAMVDEAGRVQILASRSDPFSADSMLPLGQVLRALRECPSRQKLLILDIMKPTSDPLDLGGTPDGVADAVPLEVAAAAVGKEQGGTPPLVLVACSPGETGLWSEHLGRSVFGHFFAGAFADTKADLDGGGTLSASELEKYLAERVNAYARKTRGVTQRPYLIGDGDFSIGAIVPAAASAPVASRAADKDAPAEEAAGGDPAKSAEKGKPAATAVAKKDEGSAAAPSDGLAYPDWLKKGWELRRDWWADPTTGRFAGAASPRAFRRLGAILLRAEARWRSGDDPAAVAADLQAGVAPLVEAMNHDRAVDGPSAIRSVGQAVAGGWKPDAALVSRLRVLLDDLRNSDQPADADAAAARKKAAGELAAAIKARPRPSLELAGILIEATSGVRLIPDTFRLLDGLIRDSGAKADIVELRLFQDLAVRATAPPAEWPDEAAEAARLAWDSLCLAERAAHHPSAFPWTAGLLDHADRARHEARVLLLADVRGFDSWRGVQEAWSRAAEELRKADDAQTLIEEARTELDRSRTLLSDDLAFLQASGRPGLETAWHEAARASAEVAHILGPARDGKADPGDGAGRPPIETLLNELEPALRALRAGDEALLRPFTDEAIREAIARTEAARPDPRAAAEIDALLASPLPPPDARPRLIAACRALDARLAASAQASIPDAAEAAEAGSAARLEQARPLVVRRARRLQTLLSLLGEEALASNLCAGVELEPEIRSMAGGSASTASTPGEVIVKLWGSHARIAAAAWCRLNALLERSERGDDAAGWIAPPFLPVVTANPRYAARQAESQRHGRWLAARYVQEERDLHERMAPARFYEEAAAECQGHEDAAAPAIELGLASAATPTLSSSGGLSVGVRIALIGGPGATAQARVAVHTPGDGRLKVQMAQEEPVDLSSLSPAVVNLELRWDEDGGPVDREPPPGFLFEATLADGRAFHLKVPIRIESGRMLPSFAVVPKDGDAVGVPLDPFRLRTLPGRQPFQLSLRNPSPRAREVKVELMAGDAVLASTGEKPIPLPGNSTVPVKALAPASAGMTPPKENEPLIEAPAALRLRMSEPAAGGGGLVVVQPIRPEIANPADYVGVMLAQFTPEFQGQPNQLKLVFRALPGMTGPPCQVELVLPADRALFPALLSPETAGKRADLLRKGDDLTLVAEGLRLDPGVAQQRGSFQVNLDGVKRALWYQAQFNNAGGVERAVVEAAPPRVRFRTERTVKPNESTDLRVFYQVDKAPANSRLTFALGRPAAGGFAADKEAEPRPPRRSHVGLAVGDGGVLLFEAAVEDWADAYRLNIRGKRLAVARLLDPAGRELDRYEEELVLDDQPPAIREIAVPPEVEDGGAPFDARIVVTPPVSGVREVVYVAGPKALDDAEFAKAHAEKKTAQARRSGGDREWIAPVSIPKDATGRLFITARAESGVGLTGLRGDVVKIRPRPAPADDMAAKKKDQPPAPGAIEGTVIEAGLPQPNLRVLLMNEKEKDPAKAVVKNTTTDDDGKFKLTDIAPGEYYIYSMNDVSKRYYYKPVSVPPGQTATLKMELLR